MRNVKMSTRAWAAEADKPFFRTKNSSSPSWASKAARQALIPCHKPSHHDSPPSTMKSFSTHPPTDLFSKGIITQIDGSQSSPSQGTTYNFQHFQGFHLRT